MKECTDVIASFLPSLHHVMVGHRHHVDGYMIVIPMPNQIGSGAMDIFQTKKNLQGFFQSFFL